MVIFFCHEETERSYVVDHFASLEERQLLRPLCRALFFVLLFHEEFPIVLQRFILVDWRCIGLDQLNYLEAPMVQQFIPKIRQSSSILSYHLDYKPSSYLQHFYFDYFVNYVRQQFVLFLLLMDLIH